MVLEGNPQQEVKNCPCDRHPEVIEKIKEYEERITAVEHQLIEGSGVMSNQLNMLQQIKTSIDKLVEIVNAQNTKASETSTALEVLKVLVQTAQKTADTAQSWIKGIFIFVAVAAVSLVVEQIVTRVFK